MKAQKAVADYTFLVAILILLFFGLLVLTSASSVIGLQKFGDSYFFIEKCLKFEDDHKKMNMKENLLGKSGYIEVNSNSFELLTNKMVIYYLL